MATTTPVLKLVKPAIHGEETDNVWGYDLNANFDKLDTWVGPLPDRITALETGGAATAVVSIGDTPPASPVAGQLFWESDTGGLYVFYNDGNSQQWVQINGAQGPAGPAGPAGPVGPQGPAGSGGASAPVNTALPEITGKAIEGWPLYVSIGTWEGTLTGYSYQWFRGATAIAGATTASYVLKAADVGATIHCKGTATSEGGSTTVQSNSTGVVTAAPLVYADFINGKFWYNGVWHSTFAAWLTALGGSYSGTAPPTFTPAGMGLRITDTATMPLGPTGMWPGWNATAGTLLWEGTKTDGGGGSMFVDMGAGTRYITEYYQQGYASSYIPGVSELYTIAGGNHWDSPHGAKAGLTWDATDRRLCMSGGAVTSGLANPALTGRLQVGGFPGNSIDAYCRSLSYFPKKISDAELQALTLGETVWDATPPPLPPSFSHLMLLGTASTKKDPQDD